MPGNGRSAQPSVHRASTYSGAAALGVVLARPLRPLVVPIGHVPMVSMNLACYFMISASTNACCFPFCN
jgi:hypothetical protein